MELFQFRSDILLSYDTDIDFGTGDLLVANGLEFLKRKVFKLLITEANDWKIMPDIGASPNRFTGEQNTRTIAKQIKQFVESNIQQHIAPARIDIQVVPLNYDSVKIYLDILVADSIITTMPFTFDYVNGISYTQYDDIVDKIISNQTNKINQAEDINTPNPFLDRLRRQ